MLDQAYSKDFVKPDICSVMIWNFLKLPFGISKIAKKIAKTADATKNEMTQHRLLLNITRFYSSKKMNRWGEGKALWKITLVSRTNSNSSDFEIAAFSSLLIVRIYIYFLSIIFEHSKNIHIHISLMKAIIY